MAKKQSDEKAVTLLDAALAAPPWERRMDQQHEINQLPLERRMEIMAEDQRRWQAYNSGLEQKMLEGEAAAE